MKTSNFPASFFRRIKIASQTLRLDWQTLQLARSVAKNAPSSGTRRPVIFFNASTRIRGHSLNAAFSLLASWALRLQGVPVVHFVCQRGMSRCLQGTNQDDVHRPMPCALCLRQSFVNFAATNRAGFAFHRDADLASRLHDLSIGQLMAFEYPFEDASIPLGEMVLPSMRWRLRRLTLPDDEPARFLYREFILSAWNVLQEFDLLLRRTGDAAAVVIFNGQTFPEAVVRWLALRRGLRVITHEVSMYPLSGFFTAGEVTALPMPLSPDFQLTPAMDARLDELMQARFGGQVSMAGINFFPEMKDLDPAFLQKAAQFKQLVPIFTNVIFDTTQQHSNTFFPSMFAWLDQVYPVIQAHPETLFVLRAHPDEARPGKTSRESVAMWFEQVGGASLPNLHFVPPEEFISSYELIRRSKFVLIYASTVGLEASIMGKAVLSAGASRFTSFDTVILPQDQDEYMRLLNAFLEAEVVPPRPHQIRNARRFFYFHYFIASLRFGDFIEPAALRGFVKWKPFGLQDLSPAASPTFRALLDGILEDGEFTLRP